MRRMEYGTRGRSCSAVMTGAWTHERTQADSSWPNLVLTMIDALPLWSQRTQSKVPEPSTNSSDPDMCLKLGFIHSLHKIAYGSSLPAGELVKVRYACVACSSETSLLVRGPCAKTLLYFSRH